MGKLVSPDRESCVTRCLIALRNEIDAATRKLSGNLDRQRPIEIALYALLESVRVYRLYLLFILQDRHSRLFSMGFLNEER